jgi:hypothetical protein
MIPYLKCMLVVAATIGLPPRVLPVIQAMEGGRVGLAHPDADGTADLGVMQVNTIWLPVLAARAGITIAETRHRMIDEPCFNIAAAALILRSYLAETGGAILPAVGDYHSHTVALNRAYQAEAERTVRRLFVSADPAYIHPDDPGPGGIRERNAGEP